nr:olfactory receptor 11H6-like [Anolis sagrei ordinatus]
MELDNGTKVQEFILLGFGVEQHKRLLLLIVFAVLYTLILAENLTIIILVVVDTHLAQLLMYILLSNFSWLEMCYVTTTMPRMFLDLAFPHSVISFQACFFQFYIFFSLGTTECFFLSAMALDRYLAICHPLHYQHIMSQKSCYTLVLVCWVIGMSIYIGPVTLISKLSFCGPNIIDHFLFDPGPILKLVCPPTHVFLRHIEFSMNVLIIVGNFLFVLLSYGVVIFTLMKPSYHGSRKKAFSTISFHLAVLTLFYGPVIGMYVTPGRERNFQLTKIITIFYTAVTPFLNPLIYCLRNNQVREAAWRLLRKREKWVKRKVIMEKGGKERPDVIS